MGLADLFANGLLDILTLQAVVKLVEVAVLGLLTTDHTVVGDVAVGIGGSLPLQNDLRRGV